MRELFQHWYHAINCLSLVPAIGLSGGLSGLRPSHWLVLAAPPLIGRPGGPYRSRVKPRIGWFCDFLRYNNMDHHNVPTIYFAIISYYAEICHKIIQQSLSLENIHEATSWPDIVLIFRLLWWTCSDRQEETGGRLYVGVGGVLVGNIHHVCLLSSPNCPPPVPGVRNTFYFIFTFQSPEIIFRAAPIQPCPALVHFIFV